MNRPQRLTARLATAAPAVLCLCALASPARAATTQTWVREGDVLRAGTSEGMVVTPDGRLAPGPKADVVARPAAAVLWAVTLSGGEILAGAGEDNGLVRIGKGAAPAIAGQEVFALAPGPEAGVVYAATGPSGAIYRVDLARNEAQEIARPEATYVWALVALPDGALAAATGLPGRVLRIDVKGAMGGKGVKGGKGTKDTKETKAAANGANDAANGAKDAKGSGDSGATVTTLWETKDPHVRSLALDGKGGLLAGTAGSGLLVQLDGSGKAFTIWDSERPETVAITVDGAGTIWAAFSGSAGKGEGSAPPAKAAARDGGTVNVTVRPRPDGGGGTAETDAAKPAGDEQRPVAAATDLPAGGGALLRIGVGEEPETTWSDDKETPLALALRPGGGVLLGTANPARIWWFDERGRLGLFDDRKESKAVSALAAAGDRIVAATSNPATIVSYGGGVASPARWTSDVFDAKVRTTIGRVQAIAEPSMARDYGVLVRAGNTAEPDAGWTEWTPVPGAVGPPDGDGGQVSLPRARFLQVRVEAKAAQPYGVGVSRIAVRHRPVNRSPRVELVEALPQGVAMRAMPPSQMAGGELPVVPPPRGPDLERALGDANPLWRSKKAYEPGALTVTWEARDPDGDPLRYAIGYCRDRGSRCAEADWVRLADELEQTFYSFDSRTLPDGVYRFRVLATDAPGNPAGEGRTAERISEPVAVDNVAPQVERAESTALPNGDLDITVVARDAGGRLVRAEVTREGGGFAMLAPADGVDDASQETWKGVVPAPGPGQELLVRVTDAAGNSTSRRVSAAGPSRAGAGR